MAGRDTLLILRELALRRAPPPAARGWIILGIMEALKSAEQWDDFVSERYDPNRKQEEFRKFDDSVRLKI